ncbi:MAG: hypothetical protein K2L12_05530 [Clostridia bacterium]|nr:hypothetical protein [Clostridia bacterium]
MNNRRFKVFVLMSIFSGILCLTFFGLLAYSVVVLNILLANMSLSFAVIFAGYTSFCISQACLAKKKMNKTDKNNQ